MRNRPMTKWEARIIVSLIVIILLTAPVFGVSLYQEYKFDKNVNSHMELAAESGDPATMAYHLREAREGMREVGHDGGQYAWVFKTPQTDTREHYRIMDSYISRAESLEEEENSTRVSIGIEDMRKSLKEDESLVPLHGHWNRTDPLGIYVFLGIPLFLFTVLIGWFVTMVILDDTDGYEGDGFLDTAINGAAEEE